MISEEETGNLWEWKEAQMDCMGVGTVVGQALSHTLPTRLHWRPWAEP